MIVYSVFALRGILQPEHYSCWQGFVLSCYFLCRREISDVYLKKADMLLLKFCKNVESLYGHLAITPNMHLLGPAMFLPIHKLECRCVAAHSTIPVPSSDENDTIPMTSGAEERVLFVSPLPGLIFC